MKRVLAMILAFMMLLSLMAGCGGAGEAASSEPAGQSVEETAGAEAEPPAVEPEPAQETVEQWMNSPGHRANILDPELRELGVGYCQAPDSEYGHYWVQLFRTR